MEYSTIIRKKNNGYQYVITYKLNGVWKQKSKQGFIKKGEAQIAMSEMIPQLEKMVKNNVSNDKVTFKSFYSMYIGRVNIYKERNTTITFNTAMANFKALNDIELNKIKLMDIQLCIDEMTIKGLKSKTIFAYISCLRRVLTSAYDDYNLISGVLDLKKLKIKIDKKEKEKKALTDKEIEQLLNSFKDKEYYLLIVVALKTGMRIGEILGLTWDNIDLVNKTIKVEKQWKKLQDNSYGFGILKSKNSYRTIPIPSSLCEELRNIKHHNEDNRVFNNKSTAAIALNLNRKMINFDVTCHELRHTYATKLVSAGIDFKTVAYLLGHDVKETMATYSHVNKDMIDSATNIIGKVL